MQVGFLSQGIGDNRGPVANDPKATFRTQTMIDVNMGSQSVSETSRAGLSEAVFLDAPEWFMTGSAIPRREAMEARHHAPRATEPRLRNQVFAVPNLPVAKEFAMTSRIPKYMLFMLLGALAGLVGLPIISCQISVPSWLAILLPGILFSLAIACSFLLVYPERRHELKNPRWISALAALTFGVPIALIVGGMTLPLVDQLVPGIRYQLGGVGFPFVFAESVSCIIWSLFLLLFRHLTHATHGKLPWVLCLVVPIAVMTGAEIVEIILKEMSVRDITLPLIVIAEQAFSAGVLAIVLDRQTVRGKQVEAF